MPPAVAQSKPWSWALTPCCLERCFFQSEVGGVEMFEDLTLEVPGYLVISGNFHPISSNFQVDF